MHTGPTSAVPDGDVSNTREISFGAQCLLVLETSPSGLGDLRVADRANGPVALVAEVPARYVSFMPSRFKLTGGRGPMSDVETNFDVQCPYCGEWVEIYLEPDVMGTIVMDCEVCCRPWQVFVVYDNDQRYVDVTRGDGSE